MEKSEIKCIFENKYYTTPMKKSRITLLLSLSCLLMSCSVIPVDHIKNDETLMIVSTDIRGTIHTKMIVWEYAVVSFLEKKNDKKLEPNEKELINSADILITRADEGSSILDNALQEYHGTHLQLNSTQSNEQIIQLSETINHIEAIRDVVSELDSKHRGYYYDQAGNYENNIQETYRKLQARINEYNKQPFLLFSNGMSVFLSDFWLKENAIKIYPLNYFWWDKQMKMKELEKIIEDKKIKIAFIKKDTDKEIINFLEKSRLTLYTISDIDEDTSAWGYLRLIEKLVNTFITAFNAYD